MASRIQHCLNVTKTSADVMNGGSDIKSPFVRDFLDPRAIWASYHVNNKFEKRRGSKVGIRFVSFCECEGSITTSLGVDKPSGILL